MATISEIARRANVSKTTVSRVLNGRPDVDEETAARVRRLVADLGYVPSATARALARGRGSCLGLLVPSLDLPWFYELLRGVADEVEAADHTLALHTAARGEHSMAALSAQVAARVIDGLVAVVPVGLDPHLVRLRDRGLPVVLVDDQGHGLAVPTVWATDRAGGREAARHLIALGRVPLATITGPRSSIGGRERRDGVRDALREAGLPLDERLEAEGDWTREGGEAAMLRLLAACPEVRGVFAANDLMAFGAIHALVASGRAVPGDVAVVGYDDVPMAALTTPGLTTVRQPLYEMGRAAAQKALVGIGDGSVLAAEATVFPTALVVRESCGARPLAVGGAVAGRR